MTSVDTTTRNGMGVSPRGCPVAAIANAAVIPKPSGRSNAQRLCTIAPVTSAIDKIRMIVMVGRLRRTPGYVKRESDSKAHNSKLTN